MDSKVEWVKWDELPKGMLRAFAKLFSLSESSEVVTNIFTNVRFVKVSDDLYFPVTINDTEVENSFVCSPYTAYALYSKDELMHKVKSKFVQFPLLLIIKLIDKCLRYGNIDKNVHVNNYLLSTNPYPEWNGAQIDAITKFIKENYPNHAIVFRSLNDYQHQHLLDIFHNSGYKLVGSRQVYIFDCTKEQWLKHRNNKHDNKLIKKKKLIFVPHEQMGEYLDEALVLYQKLYLEKYSKYNPQFTIDYFRTCYTENIILFQGYKDANNKLKAFSGLFIVDNTITSPLVGYDTSALQKDGLYIHAAQLAILHKFESGLLLNLSSGASQFKRMRGGKPSIEYSAVYTAHLQFRRRVVWKVLQLLSNKVGVPLIRRYKL